MKEVEWLTKVIRNTGLSPSDVTISIKGWRTIEKGQMLLRKLGIRETVFEPQLTRPDRTVFTRDVKEKIDPAGTLRLVWSFSGFAGLFGVRQDLYEVGKAYTDLSDLDQHVKSVHKVRVTKV